VSSGLDISSGRCDRVSHGFFLEGPPCIDLHVSVIVTQVGSQKEFGCPYAVTQPACPSMPLSLSLSVSRSVGPHNV